jgi:hypothetical protein
MGGQRHGRYDEMPPRQGLLIRLDANHEVLGVERARFLAVGHFYEGGLPSVQFQDHADIIKIDIDTSRGGLRSPVPLTT